MIEALVERVRALVPFTAVNTIRGYLSEPATSGGTVLEAGCGRGDTVRALKPHSNTNVVAVDIFEPYLRLCQKDNVYSNYIQADVRYLPFKDKSFDTVLSVEVLEHLEKADADRFILGLERIARKQVVITTPNGNFHLDAFDENPHQEHRSQWAPADLRRRGYSVTGHGLLGMGEVISVAPRLARYPLYLAWVIVGPIAKLFPNLSGDLVARRRLRA